jgi:HAD superfamily hydrolase (TIGR01548 family)
VAAAKSEGRSTNDWVLTRRIMMRRGVDAPLDEVTRRFEGLYQGTAGSPGLRRFETMLIDVSALRRIAARIRIGIVTGRPRADAERFLREHGIDDVPQALVCMEDGPGKPDPAPVRMALDRLRASRAWMIGDTPDDILAAKAAGVVPIGVAPPGEGGARQALVTAGAGRLLDRPDDAEGLLP